MAARVQGEMLGPGDRIPDLKIPGLDGRTYSLGETLSQGPAVFAFFKISCPVCQLALPYLEKIHRAGAAAQIRVFGVSQDDAATTGEFLREFGLSLPMLLDREEDGFPAGNGFSISQVPSLFLAGAGGEIRWSLDAFSRREYEKLGEWAGVALFGAGENVPEWKAG